MKEYLVRYYVSSDQQDGYLVILPSLWKLVWWFLRNAKRCTWIMIRVEVGAENDSIHKV